MLSKNLEIFEKFYLKVLTKFLLGIIIVGEIRGILDILVKFIEL